MVDASDSTRSGFASKGQSQQRPGKARNPSLSSSRAPSTFSPPNTSIGKKEEKLSCGHGRHLERLFCQWKAILRPLSKHTFVDVMSMEDLWDYPCAPGVISLTRNIEGNLKRRDHLASEKDVFPSIRKAQIESTKLKRLSHMCSSRVPVILHPSLYWH